MVSMVNNAAAVFLSEPEDSRGSKGVKEGFGCTDIRLGTVELLDFR